MLAWLRRIIVSVGIGGFSYALMLGVNPVTRLPDSSISMIFDRYGPLFRRAAEKSLLAKRANLMWFGRLAQTTNTGCLCVSDLAIRVCYCSAHSKQAGRSF
jgi:hypothetical protein